MHRRWSRGGAMAEFLLSAAAFVLLMVALGLVRVARGPGYADRMMAAHGTAPPKSATASAAPAAAPPRRRYGGRRRRYRGRRRGRRCVRRSARGRGGDAPMERPRPNAEAGAGASGGAATINLASLTGVNGAAQDLTGKKIRWLKLKNTGSNTVTISKGASNGYTGFGSAFSLEIKGGGEATIYCAGNGVAVAAGVRTLELAGTGTDSFSFAVGAGT